MLPKTHAKAELLGKGMRDDGTEKAAMVTLVAQASIARNPLSVRHRPTADLVAPHDGFHAFVKARNDGVA